MEIDNLKGFSFNFFKAFVNIGFIRDKEKISIGAGFGWSDNHGEFYIELLFVDFCISLDFG